MKRIVWNDIPAAERPTVLARPEQRRDRALGEVVRNIVDDVRTGGWEAMADHAQKLDGEKPKRISVAPVAAKARANLSKEQLAAIGLAYRNISAFHDAAFPSDHEVETMTGLSVRKIWRPLDRVGLYIPGGRTPLFSTLLMLAVPARSAGVEEIVVVTPPGTDGDLDPVVALAAELCGIEEIWTVGGAQAIAALAFGAGHIPRVDKVCGPGNAYVAEAKSYVASLPGGPAIDMPAGPSELMVIADDSANPHFVAADLLSQAEHDASAQVLLVTNSAGLADAVEAELDAHLVTLPRRIVAKASLAHARIILVDRIDAALDVANLYAPEHLSIAVDDPEPFITRVRNAGAVFAGHCAAETFGDYLAGSSHVLPTDGAARAWSGISVHSFLKAITVQQATPEAARALAAPAAALARIEGLEAHARAADARLEAA